MLREGDTVARVGGDEFVIVVEPWNRRHVDDLSGPDADQRRRVGVQVADRLVRAIREPFTVNGMEHAITMSIGIAYSSPVALSGHAAMSASDVLEEADAAMYLAKRQGKNRVEVSAVGRDGNARRR